MGGINRRQTLIGLGALAGGAGAIVGSGAFTTVEAQRDVEIDTAGDGAALLQLDPSGTGTIVQRDSTDGIIGFDIDSTSASGVNLNARTTFRPALRVTNNGDNTVGFYVDDNTNMGDVLDFQDHSNEDTIVGSSNAIDLSTSGEGKRIDIVIDLLGDRTSSDLTQIETVTLIAEQDAAGN